MATLVTSQTWIDTIVDYVSNEIEVWGRKQARKNGDIEALADAMRALKKWRSKYLGLKFERDLDEGEQIILTT